MNPVLAGEICGGQPATVKRREKLSALGGIGAGRATTRTNSVLLHGRVFITARWKLIGGPRFTAYPPPGRVSILRSPFSGRFPSVAGQSQCHCYLY